MQYLQVYLFSVVQEEENIVLFVNLNWNRPSDVYTNQKAFCLDEKNAILKISWSKNLCNAIEYYIIAEEI